MTVRRVLLLCALTAGGYACSTANAPVGPTGLDVPSGSSLPPSPAAPTEAPTARYVVVFDSVWSAEAHPVDFPVSAHYSGLIGGTHDASVSFWQDGGRASEGMRRMAERGSKSPLDQEVNHAIAAGTAEHLLSGPALARSPGSTSMEFTISLRFPLVTLVTMVAPSPDWFVGVSGLGLVRDGRWVDELRVLLHAYDAGTDSGVTYQSPDLATVPARPIGLLGYPVTTSSTAAPLASFTFTRIN